jgi:uncharacterized protein YkwD
MLLAAAALFGGCATSKTEKPDPKPESSYTPPPSQPKPVAPSDSAYDKEWDMARLDTARNSSYLTQVEKDIIREMNMVRQDPKKYAEFYIKPRLAYFKEEQYKVPGRTTIITSEGAAAVEACYNALASAANAPLLYPREGLSLAAKDHVQDQGKNGTIGHQGSDGSGFQDRAARYGKGLLFGENLSYGNETAREIVAQLLIDDGVPSRGHRTNIMNGQYHYAGTAAGPHKNYKYMGAILYAGSYTTRNNPQEEQEERAREAELFATRLDPDAANWNIPALDTGKNAAYLSGLEKDLLLEINKIRTNPAKYAQLYLSQNQELAAMVSAMPPAGILAPEQGLYRAAKDTQGSLSERASRYGKWGGGMSGPIIYGSYTSGKAITTALADKFLDNLMDNRYQKLGLGISKNDTYGLSAALIFAVTYTTTNR